MGVITLEAIKNLFKKGKKPKEIEFSDTFDSFRHKLEKIPTADIKDVDDLVKDKADKEAFENHAKDEALHGGSKFKTSFTPTVNWEGVKKGVEIPEDTDIEDFIKQALVKYLPPTINILTLDYSVSQPLVGQPVNITKATYSFGNDSDTNKPQNISLNWNGKDIVINGDSTEVNHKNAEGNDTPFTITQNIGGALKVATLTANDKNGNAIPKRESAKTFYNEFLFGASATVITNQATATTVFNELNKTKRNSKSITVTANANNNDNTKFTYIAYVSSYNDLSGIIQNGATPVLGAFTKVGDYVYNNGFIDLNVRVYKSNSEGAFASGTTLAIQ